MLDEIKKKVTDSGLIAPVACIWVLLVMIASIPPMLLFTALPRIAKAWQEENRFFIIILSAIVAGILTFAIENFIGFIYGFGVATGRLILATTMFALLDLIYFYPIFNKKNDEQ